MGTGEMAGLFTLRRQDLSSHIELRLIRGL